MAEAAMQADAGRLLGCPTCREASNLCQTFRHTAAGSLAHIQPKCGR